ncbi:MAG: hypothetical protein JNL43_00875 [Flavobacteriales bacterium]|nr:hypothetical protein [Flavobacteriales bacterium]
MTKQWIAGSLVYIVCVALLIWPALYNGYPILYSDTATYIASGMKLETPVDRPIIYGLFIRSTSLEGSTLWSTIVCQAALVVWCLERLIGLVRERRGSGYVSLLVMTGALSVFTSLPWVVSQVMADIFTPLLVMITLILALSVQELGRAGRMAHYLLFYFCAAVHLSHPLLAVLLIGALFLLDLVTGPTTGIRSTRAPLWWMLALTVLAYPIMSSAMAKSRHIFFMGAMVEHGVVKPYLDEHCAEQHFTLCDRKDRLPEKAYQFHWDTTGAMGSYASWKDANDEFGSIINGTLTEGRFIWLHIKVSLIATWEQLSLFDIGDGWGPFLEGTGVHSAIARYLSSDLPAMEASLQSRSSMHLVPTFARLHQWVVPIAFAALLSLLIPALRRRSAVFVTISTICMFSILLNAWSSGTFSGEVDRFGCKMIWMVPMLAVLAMQGLQRGTKSNTG